MAAVMMHWSGDLRPPQLREGFEEVLPRLPAARRDEFAAQLQQIRAGSERSREQLSADVGSCDSISPDVAPAFVQRAIVVEQAYEDLRARLAAAIDAAVQAGEVQPLQQSRLTSCPVPRPPTPGNARAQVARQANPSDYYPAAAIGAGLSGTVRVRIGIDRGGCVTHVAILASSGTQLLDQAAMRMAFDFEFIPADEGGQPRAADFFVLPVNFILRDEADRQGAESAQPQP
jgi:protein TonB